MTTPDGTNGKADSPSPQSASNSVVLHSSLLGSAIGPNLDVEDLAVLEKASLRAVNDSAYDSDDDDAVFQVQSSTFKEMLASIRKLDAESKQATAATAEAQRIMMVLRRELDVLLAKGRPEDQAELTRLKDHVASLLLDVRSKDQRILVVELELKRTRANQLEEIDKLQSQLAAEQKRASALQDDFNELKYMGRPSDREEIGQLKTALRAAVQMDVKDVLLQHAQEEPLPLAQALKEPLLNLENAITERDWVVQTLKQEVAAARVKIAKLKDERTALRDLLEAERQQPNALTSLMKALYGRRNHRIGSVNDNDQDDDDDDDDDSVPELVEAPYYHDVKDIVIVQRIGDLPQDTIATGEAPIPESFDVDEDGDVPHAVLEDGSSVFIGADNKGYMDATSKGKDKGKSPAAAAAVRNQKATNGDNADDAAAVLCELEKQKVALERQVTELQDQMGELCLRHERCEREWQARFAAHDQRVSLDHKRLYAHLFDEQRRHARAVGANTGHWDDDLFAVCEAIRKHHCEVVAALKAKQAPIADQYAKLVLAVRDMAKGEPDIFGRPEVWERLTPVDVVQKLAVLYNENKRRLDYLGKVALDKCKHAAVTTPRTIEAALAILADEVVASRTRLDYLGKHARSKAGALKWVSAEIAIDKVDSASTDDIVTYMANVIADLQMRLYGNLFSFEIGQARDENKLFCGIINKRTNDLERISTCMGLASTATIEMIIKRATELMEVNKSLDYVVGTSLGLQQGASIDAIMERLADMGNAVTAAKRFNDAIHSVVVAAYKDLDLPLDSSKTNDAEAVGRLADEAVTLRTRLDATDKHARSKAGALKWVSTKLSIDVATANTDDIVTYIADVISALQMRLNYDVLSLEHQLDRAREENKLFCGIINKRINDLERISTCMGLAYTATIEMIIKRATELMEVNKCQLGHARDETILLCEFDKKLDKLDNDMGRICESLGLHPGETVDEIVKHASDLRKQHATQVCLVGNAKDALDRLEKEKARTFDAVKRACELVKWQTPCGLDNIAARIVELAEEVVKLRGDTNTAKARLVGSYNDLRGAIFDACRHINMSTTQCRVVDIPLKLASEAKRLAEMLHMLEHDIDAFAHEHKLWSPNSNGQRRTIVGKMATILVAFDSLSPLSSSRVRFGESSLSPSPPPPISCTVCDPEATL